MKTGYHGMLEDFIQMHSLHGQQFDMTGEYYTLHSYDLDSYDRRFAIIDFRQHNCKFKDNHEFDSELKKRCDFLTSKGFVFIKANPWESLHNIISGHDPGDYYPIIDIKHIKWTGGASWFWYYMYSKYRDKHFRFDHSNKKYDFLYLNKRPRKHRIILYNKLYSKGALKNSLHTNWPERKLPPEYELPWAQEYPSIGRDQDIFENPYNDTKYSLVSETNDTNDEVFMTEKIWKPIIAQQPFVVHGNYLYLQKLREMGFKTFSSYYDEGYDLEKDEYKRIDQIIKTCCDLLLKDWRDIYLQTQYLRKHNYDTFFNEKKLSLEINKTLNLFLEFADRS
jgi:hypothetical protein